MSADEDLVVGELRLRRGSHELQWGTQSVHLSPQEQTLLALFLAAPGALLDASLLKATLGVSSPARYSSYLYFAISQHRRKLAQLQYPGKIAVFWGQGYRFVPSAEPPPARPSLLLLPRASRRARRLTTPR